MDYQRNFSTRSVGVEFIPILAAAGAFTNISFVAVGRGINPAPMVDVCNALIIHVLPARLFYHRHLVNVIPLLGQIDSGSVLSVVRPNSSCPCPLFFMHNAFCVIE